MVAVSKPAAGPVAPALEAPGGDEGGLGVAQIVITAATPMFEEAELPFPPAEEVIEPAAETEDAEDEESSQSEQTAVAVVPPASSSASEGSGPPSAPHSPPAAPRAGRASIPDELEPAQLARLTDLKESNA